MSDPERTHQLRITGPAERQLAGLSEGTAAAIIEFMLGDLVAHPYRVGGRLQRELADLRSAPRGVYRVVYEIDDAEHLVIVHRIDHRATVYRPAERTDGTPRSRSSQLDGVVQDVSRDA